MSASVVSPLRTVPALVRFKAVPGAVPLGAILAGTLVLAAAAVGLLHLDALPFTVCLFKLMTGFPCLTCGTTRALGRLVHGDLYGAWLMNPLAASGALALVPWAAADLLLMIRGRALGVELAPAAARAARVAVVAAALANWAYLVAAGR
jgi:uncharacterized protein DUF2752